MRWGVEVKRSINPLLAQQAHAQHDDDAPAESDENIAELPRADDDCAEEPRSASQG